MLIGDALQSGKEEETAWHRGREVAHCCCQNGCQHREDFSGMVIEHVARTNAKHYLRVLVVLTRS